MKKCTNCNKEFDDSISFCNQCGTRLVDVQELSPEETIQTAQHGLKKVPVWVMLLVVVLLVGGVGIGIGIRQTSAKSSLQKYVDAIVSKDWETAFQYMEAAGETDNISKDVYADWVQQAFTDIQSYSMEIVEDTDIYKKYTVEFIGTEDTVFFQNTYTVKKQDSKKMLIFPDWQLDSSAFIVKNTMFSVPEGAEILFDGVQLTPIAEPENGMVTYQVDIAFVGPHSLMITKQYYQEHEEQIQLTEDVAENGPMVFDLSISESVVQNAAFTVPSGAQFSFDDEAVEEGYKISSENGVDTYQIPFVESGEHRVKVTKQYYNDYEEVIQINNEIMAAGPVALMPVMNEAEAWRKVYYDFLMAVSTQGIDVLSTQYPDMIKDINKLYEEGKYLPDTGLKFTTLYIDDDNIPELLLTYNDACGLFCSYKEGEIKTIQIIGSYSPQWENVFRSERGFFGVVEREGLIVDGGSSGASYNSLQVLQYNRDLQQAEQILDYRLYADESTDFEYVGKKNGKRISVSKVEKQMDEYQNKIQCGPGDAVEINAENLAKVLDFTDVVEGTMEETFEENNDSYIEDGYCSGYKMLVPEDFYLYLREDNLTAYKDDLEAVLVWGGRHKSETDYEEGFSYYPDGKTYQEECLGWITDLTYNEATKDYCCYSYISGDQIIYCAFHFDGELTYGFELRYSLGQEEYYAPLVERLSDYVTQNKGIE